MSSANYLSQEEYTQTPATESSLLTDVGQGGDGDDSDSTILGSYWLAMHSSDQEHVSGGEEMAEPPQKDAESLPGDGGSLGHGTKIKGTPRRKRRAGLSLPPKAPKKPKRMTLRDMQQDTQVSVARIRKDLNLVQDRVLICEKDVFYNEERMENLCRIVTDMRRDVDRLCGKSSVAGHLD